MRNLRTQTRCVDKGSRTDWPRIFQALRRRTRVSGMQRRVKRLPSLRRLHHSVAPRRRPTIWPLMLPSILRPNPGRSRSWRQDWPSS